MSSSTTNHACEVCGSTRTQFLFTAKDKNRRVDERQFSIMRCNNCGVGWTIPKHSRTELSRYYTQEYYSLDTNVKLEEATRPHNQTRIERIRRLVGSGKLIDIGAGTGMFLKAAKENGFDAYGLEISEEAVAFGRRTWGLNIRQGNLLETPLPSNTYDVATLGHVYEHLHEPHQTANMLHSILKQGGLLVVAVPNFESLQAKLFRAKWFHLDVPRHLFHYTPSGMRRIIEEAGFEVVAVSFLSAEHNWAGILGSVMHLSRPGESVLHKFIRKAIGVPVARVLAYIEAILGRGGTFEIYAIRQ
jgi:2-polyprenyl-3-methyl-5-hydroxy-6-metoxy-1,4-benzoquinol methylase